MTKVCSMTGHLTTLGSTRDTLEATLDQALQKSRPQRLGLRGTNAEPDDLASAFGRDRQGDYRRDRDDPAAVAYFEVDGIEPKIRPFAVDRPVEKGLTRLWMSLHSLETWLFEMPLRPIACTSSSTRRVETQATATRSCRRV
jgi:hypothetical protein